MKIKSITKHSVKLITGKEKLKCVSPEKNYLNKIFYDDLDDSKLQTNNIHKYNKLLAIDGVGFSGSSAVTDFFGEFSNCTSLGGVDMRENPDRGEENCYEIDFLREPGSLISLESIYNNHTGRVRDAAIDNFIKVCYQYYESDISIFGDLFLNEAKVFLKKITNYAFNDSPTHVTYHVKEISLNEYRSYAKQFLEAILKNIPSKEILVCDNLMSVGYPDKEILSGYFGDYKKIFNYCDPRDVYARARLQPGNEWVPVDPEIFCKNWENGIIQRINSNDPNVLITNFDDFCNDYENQAKKIMDFIGITEKDHVNKFKYFNPKISINNTQVWKKLENQKAIDYIFEHLKEYCYDFEHKKRY